jgi:hypothetical protein
MQKPHHQLETTMSDGYIKHRVTISGDRLLMHNGQTADPLNRYAKAMRAITSDRTLKKTDDGILELMKIEYEAGLYLDTKKRVVIPSRVLEAHIAEGARKTKEGKTALAGSFVDCDATLSYDGGPLTVKQLIDSEDHRLTVGVGVNNSRIMRTRPLFTNWSATFEVSVLAEMAGSSSLKTWLTNGGKFIGIGDYRPRYGRYEVSNFEVL